MTHAQWHALVRKSLAMVERQPIRALASLHKLVHQLQSESKKTAGDWHIEQTLEVISIVQSHQENHWRSAETILAVADRHEQQLVVLQSRIRGSMRDSRNSHLREIAKRRCAQRLAALRGRRRLP